MKLSEIGSGGVVTKVDAEVIRGAINRDGKLILKI